MERVFLVRGRGREWRIRRLVRLRAGAVVRGLLATAAAVGTACGVSRVGRVRRAVARAVALGAVARPLSRGRAVRAVQCFSYELALGYYK
mgnify:CR=1 FL=1